MNVDDRYSVQELSYYNGFYRIIDNRDGTGIGKTRFNNLPYAEKVCRGLNKIVAMVNAEPDSDAEECIFWLIKR
jgi:hypothetical protein